MTGADRAELLVEPARFQGWVGHGRNLPGVHAGSPPPSPGCRQVRRGESGRIGLFMRL